MNLISAPQARRRCAGSLLALVWLLSAICRAETEVHPAVGAPAPDFELATLDGGHAKLSEHNGKDLVVLDFWATWCGPCVASLPLLAETAAAYREKGVVFYAVNERENPEAVRTFLERQKLALTAALDRDGAVGRSYSVEGIPQTVIVDKSGVVAAVHIGFQPNLKEQLGHELDLLLAGKPLTGKKSEPKLEGLELAWSYPGRWSGLAPEGSNVRALSPAGGWVLLDDQGKNVGEGQFPGANGLLRPLHLAGGKAGLLSFAPWGPVLLAADASGLPLWQYPRGQGIDDVVAADLRGSGADEVIVGYNGRTGLHVLDAEGKLLWKTTEIGNVWHVCAGDFLGVGALQVATTAADGQIHLYGADGKAGPTLEAEDFYAHMLRAGGGRPAALYTAGTRSEEREAIAAIDIKGNLRWAVDLGKNSHVDSMQIAPGREWLGAAVRGGRLLVIDGGAGKILGSAQSEAQRAEVIWLVPRDGAAPLLVATGVGGVRAYRVLAQ